MSQQRDESLAFMRWKEAVNMHVQAKLHVDCDDLPDLDYRGLYGSGYTPEEAANLAIERATSCFAS